MLRGADDGSKNPSLEGKGSSRRSIDGCGEIKRLADEVMKGAETDSRVPFLINRGIEIDIRGLCDAFDESEKAFRPSKMNNRGDGEINRGVERSIEGSRRTSHFPFSTGAEHT